MGIADSEGASGRNATPPSSVTGATARTALDRSTVWRFLEKPYLRSLGAQALVSAFHFALNLYLVRQVSPHEYGSFAFAFVLGLFAAAINNALISTPLTVYTPVIVDQATRTRQEGMLSTLNSALSLTLLISSLAVSLIIDVGGLLLPGVAIYVAAYAARQYTRGLGYARLRPLVTASGDAVYVISGLMMMLALWAMPVRTDIGLVLLILATAHALAMMVELGQLNGLRWPRGSSRADLGEYRPIWLQARWALIGALTTLFMGQAHSVIINSTLGPAAFAPLAAGFVLFGPVRVALLTWQNMVKPEMAIALSRGESHRIGKSLQRNTALMIAAVLAMGLALWIGWPWVHALLYARQYADAPMGQIVLLWCLVTLLSTLYCAPSAALQAMKQFRLLAIGTLYGAALSGLLVALLLWRFDASSTLFALMAAELLVAIYLIRETVRHLARRQAMP